MSDTLYRKYRPKSFDEIIGQDHVVSVLQGAIKNDGVSHAYLFSGSRGTGKTSIARILAQEIGTSEKDLYEMDAASNRGIDDIRELRDAVHTLPYDSPKKVYIIDEVHMLTKEAFNALLKTLEEPPPHVMFVLATTEPHKLPDTVVSRCETYTFKKPSIAILRKFIVDAAKKEGRTFDDTGSAELIALLSEGSFRDSLGILQKILSSTESKKISEAEITDVTGAPPTALVQKVIDSLHTGNPEKGMQALHEAGEGGADARVFLKLLLYRLRAILLLRFAPGLKEELEEEFSDTDYSALLDIAGDIKSHIRGKTIARFLHAEEELLFSTIPFLPLELALSDACEQ